MRESEVAWAAGLFEGEGSIAILGNSVRLHLAMTDEDTVYRFREIVGVGGICIRRIRRTQPLHTWHLNKRADVERVLTLLLPWLSSRRTARAMEALGVIERFHRECNVCGEPFLALRSNRIYCGDRCATYARRKARKLTV
jgi:ribosomal protein S27AE